MDGCPEDVQALVSAITTIVGGLQPCRVGCPSSSSDVGHTHWMWAPDTVYLACTIVGWREGIRVSTSTGRSAGELYLESLSAGELYLAPLLSVHCLSLTFILLFHICGSPLLAFAMNVTTFVTGSCNFQWLIHNPD